MFGIQVAEDGCCHVNYNEYLYLQKVHSDKAGLGHAHIYTSRSPNTLYGVQIMTESYHALANRYMGSYNQTNKTKRRALSCNFSNLSEFRLPQNIQETGQYEKLDEIKDLYIAIRQSVFKYFPILFMAFIWVDALEHNFEIWVLYRLLLLFKVTHST